MNLFQMMMFQMMMMTRKKRIVYSSLYCNDKGLDSSNEKKLYDYILK